MARPISKGLSGLSKPGKKGTASMTIESSNPKSAPVIDTTKPAPFSERLASPKKPGMPTASISPSPKAGPGWKAQNVPAVPGAIARPSYSGIVKT